MQQMRILQVLPELNTGGVERGTVDLAKAIVETGGAAFVASNGGRLVPDLQRHGVIHIQLPLHSKSPWRIWRNASHLAKLIRQHDINVIHARSRAPGWSALWASRRTGIPLVTTYHAAYGDKSRLKRFYNRVMVAGARVIAISKYIQNHILERYSTVADRLVLIHRGVNTELFNPQTASSNRMAQLARIWNIPDGMPILMLPGRLSRRKGHCELLPVLKKIAHLEWFCVIVGDGPHQKHMEQAITEAGLNERVRLVGTCQDMPSAYMLADVVIHPSTWPEGFGRTIAEAQAMGRPVVASDVGAVAEIVEHGKTGWLVSLKDNQLDIDAFAEALTQALSLDQTDRQTLAKAARQRIVKFFNHTLMLEKTLTVYRAVIRGANAVHAEEDAEVHEDRAAR